MLKPLLVAASMSALLGGCAAMPASDLDSGTLPSSVAAQPNCLTTGSRITRPEGECVGLPGRAYSKEDLDRTGATDVDEALRRLDPSLFFP